MGTEDLDKDLLDTLTDEERQALEADDYTPEEVEAMKSLAGDVEDEPVEPEVKAEEIETAEPITAEGEPADEQPKAEATRSRREDVTRYTAQLPTDFTNQIEDLNAQRGAIWQQFDDGEIERKELEEKLMGLDDKKSALSAMRIKAEISQEMTQQQEQQLWTQAVSRVVDAVADEIDYRKDPGKARDLDAFFKALVDDDGNEGRPRDWFVQEAHRRVLILHGINPSVEERPGAKVTARPAPDPSKAPKTLANVPGGEGPGDVGDEFSDIDAMDGDELEAAVAKMTPAQRAKYIAA